MLHTLSLYSTQCQYYLNKTGRRKNQTVQVVCQINWGPYNETTLLRITNFHPSNPKIFIKKSNQRPNIIYYTNKVKQSNCKKKKRVLVSKHFDSILLFCGGNIICCFSKALYICQLWKVSSGRLALEPGLNPVYTY